MHSLLLIARAPGAVGPFPPYPLPVLESLPDAAVAYVLNPNGVILPPGLMDPGSALGCVPPVPACSCSSASATATHLPHQPGWRLTPSGKTIEARRLIRKILGARRLLGRCLKGEALTTDERNKMLSLEVWERELSRELQHKNP